MVAKCRTLVFIAAKDYKVAPVCITAHTRVIKADKARKWVMQMMLREGMRRWQIAWLFQRDVRRVRKSVLGV